MVDCKWQSMGTGGFSPMPAKVVSPELLWSNINGHLDKGDMIETGGVHDG
ncbi:MAG: hypothetical protein ETSY2_52225 [Candidatus Entotheonella gemina]|uniref:Uncharacterized protein n=1 Tax=Candidatus Entotheonella gemina TaxID=1429439 RepID=W4L5K6_9BACT|nr:MAG: hypothetical protein ETSY2_52225 [Candidatus Entotheonella gemina]